VSYFAAAVTRGSSSWTASVLDLGGAADIDEVVDRLRDVDADADVALLFVESDDSYLAVLRLDQGEDLRVFGSDSVFAEESRLGALLLGDVKAPALEIDDVTNPPADDEAPTPPATEPDVDPVGDPEILADLGISARQLLSLCAHEGLMPADVTAEICQVLGCADAVEDLRG